MSKQIAVVLSEEDERSFLSFLFTEYNIAMFVSFAKTEELLWKHNVDEIAGHEKYYVWNKDFPWKPQYERSVYDSYNISNIYGAPIIELIRSDISQKKYGRIYWSKYFGAPNGLSYDVDRFETWYAQIIKWVKRNSAGKLTGNWTTYFLPNAWAIFSNYNK